MCRSAEAASRGKSVPGDAGENEVNRRSWKRYSLKKKGRQWRPLVFQKRLLLVFILQRFGRDFAIEGHHPCCQILILGVTYQQRLQFIAIGKDLFQKFDIQVIEYPLVDLGFQIDRSGQSLLFHARHNDSEHTRMVTCA